MSKPAIRIGDNVSCGDNSAEGSGNVFVNGIPLSRMNDQTAGHGGFPPTDFNDGSAVVFTNNKPTVYVSTTINIHCDDDSCHGGEAAVGSPDVFIGEQSVSVAVAAIEAHTAPGALALDFAYHITCDQGEDLQQRAMYNQIMSQNPGENVQEESVNADESPPPPAPADIPTDCRDIYDYPGNLPGSFQLSPNFTLAQLTTNTLVSNYALRDQKGLTAKDIACNLRMLCINVLEPMRSRYGSMRINSGFRHGSGGSQHNTGQAVDVSFSNLSGSAAHFERAKDIRDNINYDAFFYEQNNSIWFHVSYNSKGSRRLVKTKPRGNTWYNGLHQIKV